MSRHQTARRELPTPAQPPSSSSSLALSMVSGVAGTLFGIIVGYLLAVQPGAPAGQPAAVAVVGAAGAPAAAPSAGVPLVNEQEIQTYKDILARDPGNLRAATQLGNMLYDAHRFAEAVPYYQQAFKLSPKDINISTDLGTSLWYSGRPDEALAQYALSLAIDPSHPQTLMNMGIVRQDGKGDPQGAIDAWETLLKTNPGFPEAGRVQALIDEARQRPGGAAR
jgi:cytochrome c-type biogenesis protein CcmH/NrfG